MYRSLTLLFGMPRSGTSWIGKVFDSHPETVYRHEPDSWRRLDGLGVPLLPDPADAERYRETIQGYCRTLPAMCFSKVCGKLPLFRKRYQGALGFRANQAGLYLAKAVGGRLGVQWVPNAARGLRPDETRMVWKSIESVGRLGTILGIVPEARGILILRHPCGYVASVLRGEDRGSFGDDAPSSTDYNLFAMLLDTPFARAQGMTLDALKALEPEERLAWRWLLYNEKAAGEIGGLTNARSVWYEAICLDPAARYRELFEFAGLEWNAQTDEFLSRSVARQNGAYYSVFKDPRKAAFSWQAELPDDKVQRILAVASRGALLRSMADPADR